MPEYRFGISLLSKEKLEDAYLEELMVDKSTGEVLVKTPSGDTISYNYNSRVKSHLTETKTIANNVSVYGDIISIEMDNVNAPFTMTFGKNYLQNELPIIYPRCKKILFNADIDCITVNTQGISRDRNNISLELVMSVMFSDDSRSEPIVINGSINQFNQRVFNLADYADNENVSGIVITSFMAVDNLVDYSGNVINDSIIKRPIFNSLFAVIQV